MFFTVLAIELRQHNSAASAPNDTQIPVIYVMYLKESFKKLEKQIKTQ